MHIPFKARLGSNEIQILVSKDMSVQEMLDALSYALSLSSYSQIVGFRDPNTGMIIPPSVVCSDPQQIIKNEIYEVMIRQVSSQPFQGSLGGAERSQHVTQNSSTQNTQLGETQASFNARVGNLQQVIGSVQGIASSGLSSAAPANQHVSVLGAEFSSQRDQQQLRSNNQAQNIIQEQQRLGQQNASIRPSFIPEAHTRQTSTAPAGVERERSNFSYSDSTKQNLIRLIQSWSTDALLTEQLKFKIIEKIQNEDSGIMGAYRLYTTDRDLEGFKARIIHKLLGGNLGSETLSAEERPSSMTTAGFNRSADYLSRFSRGSIGPGGAGAHPGALQHQYGGQSQNRFQRFVRPTTRERGEEGQTASQSTQDRYLPIIINFEASNLLDEQTSSLLKTLILEENVAIFRLINGFIARAIDEQELCAKLIRLAQQMGTYMERPMSPIPKNKKQLLQFVNSLTRYHFTEKEDVELLNKLIQEENEFVLSCFDVFDSDKDHENLIDSLQRILDKSKSIGLQYQRITPSAFYQNYENGSVWNQNERAVRERIQVHNTPQPAHNFGFGQMNIGDNEQSHRMTRPETSQWNERPLIPHQQTSANSYNPPHAGRDNIFNSMQPAVRSSSFAKGGSLRMGNHRSVMQQMVGNPNQMPNHRRRDRSHLVGVHGMQNDPQFQPQPTTTHKVALIPNYFSSGEEENNGFPQHVSMKNQRRGYAKQAGRGKYMAQAMSSMGQYPVPRGYQPNSMHDGGNLAYQYYVDRGYPAHPYYGPSSQTMNDNFNHAFEDASEMARRFAAHRGSQKATRPGQYRAHMNNFLQTTDGHEDLSAGQGKYAQMPYSQSVVSNNAVDEYGDELYHPAMASHMSQMPNQTPSNYFVSDAKRSGQGATSKYGAKRNNHKKSHKSKKNKRGKGRQYSSEEEVAQQERHRYRAGGFEGDDINQRANIADYSNYRDSKSDLGGFTSSSGSDDSDSNSSSDSSSEGSSVSKKREKERKSKEKKAKEAVKKANKANKQRKKQQKKLQKMKHIDFQKIIEGEGLARKMRIDNYAILLYLTDQNDQEIKTYFATHLKAGSGQHGDSTFEGSSLLSQVTAKTEETYQALLEKHLTNSEYNIIRNKRSLKDGEYQEIFKQLINIGNSQFDIEHLIQNLKSFASVEEHRVQNEQQQALQQVSKEQVEQVFYGILYDSFKTNDDKERFLRHQFEAENPQLLDLLASQLQSKDVAKLRSQVSQYLLENLGPDHFKNLKDAINGLYKKSYITTEDLDLIRELSLNDDKHLLAAWDAYTLMHDEEDFADTLQVLCDVKREKRSKNRPNEAQGFSIQQSFNINGPQREDTDGGQRQSQRNQYRNGSHHSSGNGPEVDSLDRDEATNQNQPDFYEQQRQPPQFVALFNPRPGEPQGSEDEERSREDNGVDMDSDDQEDPDYMEDIDGIMQYQHKILRKYAMLGMIKYCAVPFFHSLVTSRDYKMICIFEVFAQNRNEDDFLENLGILNNIRLHNEEQQQLQEQQEDGNSSEKFVQNELEKANQEHFVTHNEFEDRNAQLNDSNASELQVQHELEETPPEPADPNMTLLLEVQGRLKPEEFEFFKPKVEGKDKRTLMMIKCYRTTKDQDDFVNSLQRAFGKAQK